MTDLTFDDLRWLHLLWAVLAVALIGLFGVWQRQRALRRFASANLLGRLVPGAGWVRPVTRLLLVLATLIALVAALIGPRWGEATQQMIRRNVDVMILLDVSRSMLAEDIVPSRLERAKLALRDDLLPAMGGDRVGLITFAGTATLSCPLTTDYGFFRLALEDVGVRSAARGGTLIGDAVRLAGEVFADEIDTHKIIVLITDGEDQESFPVEAAANVWEEQQIPIVALPLGDPEQGARVPVRPGADEYVQYEGDVVWSKADFATLERMTAVSDQGVFVPVGTSNFHLDEIYREVVGRMRADEQAEQRSIHQPSRYHPFAVAALLFLLVDSLLRDGPRRVRAMAGVIGREEKAA